VRFLGLPRWLGELAALADIGAYVLAVGPQPSVIRGGIARSLAPIAGPTQGRVVRADPRQRRCSPGTGTSSTTRASRSHCAAAAAIFLPALRIARRLEGHPMPGTVRLVVVPVSTACGLVTAPIVWLQCGALPVLAVVANVLAEPANAAPAALGLATAALDAVSPEAAAVLAWVSGSIAEYTVLYARAVGSLPSAQVQGPEAVAARAGVLLLAAYAWRRWQRN
jgi:competence protein ComEC